MPAPLVPDVATSDPAVRYHLNDTNKMKPDDGHSYDRDRELLHLHRKIPRPADHDRNNSVLPASAVSNLPSDQSLNLRSKESAICRFEAMTRNAAVVQKRVLQRILEANVSCEYLRNCGLRPGQKVDAASFKRLVPLVTHADVKPFIDRIVNGDRSAILTGAAIDAMSLSSGTTDGREKYIPYYEGLKKGTLEVASIAAAYRERVYPLSPDARILEFTFCGKFFTTEGGLRAGTGTTHLIRGDAFKQRQLMCNKARPCSPKEVVLASDCRQAMYCHLLCGLLQRHQVEIISAIFAYTLLEAFRSLERQWRDLCDDIRCGQLSPSIVTDPSLRVAVSGLLVPNPELAARLSKICSRAESADTCWLGAVRSLWPRCKYLLSINTGAMEPYVDRLRHFAGSEIPVVSADYGASEGWVGVNLDPTSSPSDVSFTVIPSLAYFEFIPLSRPHRCEGGEPVCLTDVKVGQEYEIVMTTTGGLYRYRLGDVLKVTGFFNQSPQFSYVRRRNVILSVNIDKVTEKDLKIVMKKAATRLAALSGHTMDILDYSSYADQKEALGHYIIFWEVQGSQRKPLYPLNNHNNIQNILFNKTPNQEHNVQSTWFDECATIMDSSFIEPGYVTSRRMKSIGALELCVLRQGTFSRLLDQYMVIKGAAITQYKTPRCIVSKDVLSFLLKNTSSRHFSSATFH